MKSLVPLLFLAMTLPAFAAGPETSGAGGPKMNTTVFSDASITSVTAVTQVFGKGQKVTAAVVELAQPVSSASVADFSVDDRNITAARVVATPDISAPAATGRFVILTLDPADPAAVVFAPGVTKAAQIAVHQTRALGPLPAGEKAVLSTRVQNLIVDDFQIFRFTDPQTGLHIDYNLYIPKNYDPAQAYPLVLFLHDAGVTGSNPKQVLEQGLGAVSFASPEDQSKHPAFVLAPQFPAALVNDAAQVSPYVEMIPRLLAEVRAKYAIDAKRLYTTGQSGGCMSSLALGLSHPELFAATLCVAGQWEPAITIPPTGPFWGIVSEDDKKAFPGMGAIMAAAETKGRVVKRATLDAKAAPSTMAAAVAKIRADAGTTTMVFTPFIAGSVLEGDTSPGAGHVNTWAYAYDIPALRDWLFDQHR